MSTNTKTWADFCRRQLARLTTGADRVDDPPACLGDVVECWHRGGKVYEIQRPGHDRYSTYLIYRGRAVQICRGHWALGPAAEYLAEKAARRTVTIGPAEAVTLEISKP